MKRLSDDEFRQICNMLMITDLIDECDRYHIVELANSEATLRGFENWLDAYLRRF